MRQSRLSGSVEGVMGNHDSYSDSFTYPVDARLPDAAIQQIMVTPARRSIGGT